MKKVLFLFIFSLSYLGYGQSINDDYKLAQRYRELAIEAHEAGDYEQSIEFAKRSREYSDRFISKYGIYEYVLNSQIDAERKLNLFKGIGGETNQNTSISNLYSLAADDMQSARNIFNVASNDTDYSNTIIKYQDSSLKSQLGYDLLSIDLRRDYLISESVLTNGDNNDKEILNLQSNARSYLERTDYINSSENAKEAVYILDRLEAPLAYAKAQEALNKARESGYNTSKTAIYNEASQSLTNADTALRDEDYSNSLMHSKNVIVLANLMGSSDSKYGETPKETVFTGTFPQYYIVVERTKNTDSLWLISSYDFIYGDGKLWRKIYEANKDKIKNPNIIRKGQILIIPSLKGEKREGTYNSNNTYNSIKE